MAEAKKKSGPAKATPARVVVAAIRLTRSKIVRDTVIAHPGQVVGVPDECSAEKADWLVKHGFAEVVKE